jgi:ABC-type branched-subunit amino acid transport system substrate-binding protein
MRRFSVRVGLAAVLALGALTTVTAATAGGKAGAPLKLFVSAAVGSGTQNYPDSQAGAEAAAAAINKAGGIKGRQVQIIFCNNQSVSATAVNCARQAVDAGAVAVVGHVTSASTFDIPVYAQAGIPDIGNWTVGNPIDWTNPNEFPIAGGTAGAYSSLPFAFKKLGKKRLVIVIQDVPASAAGGKIAKNAAKVAGVPVVGTILLPGSTTDFAPQAQKLRELNPDSVEFITSAGVSGGLMRAAFSLGVKPLWSHNSASIGEAEVGQIGAPAEGMLLAGAFPTYHDTQVPGIKRWLAEMKAAGKDDVTQLKQLGLDAWLSVYAVKMLSAKIKGEITAASLTKALRAQKKPLDLFGLASYAPGQKGPSAYPRFGQIKTYFLAARNGEVRSWGSALPPIFPLQKLHYVR